MAEQVPFAGRAYGDASFSGSASVQQGDKFEYGNNFKIENANITILNESVTPHSPHKLLTNTPYFEYVQRRGKALALLWIDGELQDGLMSLYILKYFMERVAQAKRSEELHKPCEFFDLIGGRGAGGLIALMLGRLELSVDECISRYVALVKQSLVTSQSGSNRDDQVQANAPLEHATFTGQTLHRACRTVLQESFSEDEPFLVTSAVSCKVFIDFLDSEAPSRRNLRSYQSRSSQRRLTIGQAVEAVLGNLSLSVSYNADPEQAIATHQLRPIWEEAETTLLDYDQKLENHLDLLMMLGNPAPGLNPWPGFVDALEDRLCQLCTATLCQEVANLAPCDTETSMLSVEHYLRRSSIANYFARRVDRAAQHLVTPGFALLHASERPMVLSGDHHRQSTLLDRISSYDARIAHWERSQPRLRGTCTWISANEEFAEWHRTNGTSVLSCIGIVGCGKSILAAAVIDHMKELALDACNGCVHYFFDTGNASATSLNDLLRAFLKQLLPVGTITNALPLQLSDEIQSAFLEHQPYPSTNQLTALLQKVINTSPKMLYLIDGFDDMEEPQIQKLFAFLRVTFRNENPHGSKLALFSREVLGRGIETRRSLRTIAQLFEIRLSLTHLSSDIARFVEAQVEEQQLNRTITEDIALIAEIKQRLKENGEKMFLWIHLQVLSIWNSDANLNEDGIRALINDLPSGIDATYARCLRRIRYHENQRCREIAAKTFRWVAVARRPLTHRQAREAVSLDSKNLSIQESAILNSSPTNYCGNLVTTDLTNRRIQFTHASVKTFLQNIRRLPPDLVEFRIDLQSDDLWCAELCFSYLDFLQSCKQVAPRQEISIPGDVSQTFLRGVPFASGIGFVSRVLAKRTTSPSHIRAIPVPVRVPQVAELHMHDYLIKFWLSHTSQITPGAACYSHFRKYCLSFDPELFPWLDTATINSAVYQKQLQQAVLEGHTPMLHVISEHIRLEKPNLIASIFQSPCPGTSAHLIHVAAALGNADIVAELRPSSRIDALDEDGKTPLAWAAENSHFQVVEFLVSEAAANVVACRRLSTDPVAPTYHDPTCSLSLLTFLVDQETSDGFWYFSYYFSDLLKPCLSNSPISQALFAACNKGHVDVAKQLIRLGADPTHYSPFAWPGQENRIQGWPLMVNLELAGVDGAVTLLAACDPLKAPSAELTELLVTHICALPASDAIRLATVLCQPETVLFLRDKFAYTWFDIIIRACASSPLASATEWRDLVRSVLHFEISSGHYFQRRANFILQDVMEVRDLLNWLEAVPDDILTMLIRAGYFVKSGADRPDSPDFLQALSRRMSSRPLNALSQYWPQTWNFSYDANGEALANARAIVNRETLEAMLYNAWENNFMHLIWRDYVKSVLRLSILPTHQAIEDLRTSLGDATHSVFPSPTTRMHEHQKTRTPYIYASELCAIASRT